MSKRCFLKSPRTIRSRRRRGFGVDVGSMKTLDRIGFVEPFIAISP